MVRGDGPIEDREKGEFVLLQIDTCGQGRLYRGAKIKRVRQAGQPGAGDLVNVFALAIRHGVPASALRETIWAYPTHASDVPYML